MTRNEMIEAHREAAAALNAGAALAKRAAMARGGMAKGSPTGGELGALLGDPASFWAAAAAVEARGDGETVEGVACATRLAAAKLAAGDYSHVRESLIGQAAWLGAIAAKWASRADDAVRPERAADMLRVALAAQRQAAQALCSAAALEKLDDAQSVTVD